MGTAPLKNRHWTTCSHGPGTPKFLGTRVHKISIYTIKTEGTVPKILGTGAKLWGCRAQNVYRVYRALFRGPVGFPF